MPRMPICERRFREGTGEKYLNNGGIRCQAVSKSKLRQWRIEYADEDATAEDTWPETQCPKPAEPGAFACRFHGGQTPKKLANAPKSILDTMPLDLAEKLKTLMQNPQYWSRREDIMLMQARNWELMEELQESTGNTEAWDYVHEAIVALKRGRENEALLLLEEAKEHTDRRKEVWKEVRQNENVIKELTNTQVRTVKDLKQMATAEQVSAVLLNLYDIVANGAQKYIHDPNARSQYLRDIAKAIGRYANLSPLAVGGETESGFDTIDGETV